MSNSLQPHGQYPTMFLCPWNSPGKDTTVGCLSLHQGISMTDPGIKPRSPSLQADSLTNWVTRKGHVFLKVNVNNVFILSILIVSIQWKSNQKQLGITCISFLNMRLVFLTAFSNITWHLTRPTSNQNSTIVLYVATSWLLTTLSTYFFHFWNLTGFPHSSVGKGSACNTRDQGSIPGMGKSPGEGNGNPFQYSCLENSRDRGAWRATVHGVTRVGHDSD